MLALLAAADTLLEAPGSAPATTTVVAGALTGATYLSKATFVNAAGMESAASAEGSQAVATNSVWKATGVAAVGDAVSVNYYVTQPGGATGTEVLVGNALCGVAFQQPNGGFVYGTQTPPSTALPNANVVFASAPTVNGQGVLVVPSHAFEVVVSVLFAAVSGTTGANMIVNKILNGVSTKISPTIAIPGVAGVAQQASFRVDKLQVGNFDHIGIGVSNLDTTNVPIVAIMVQGLEAV